MHCCQTFCWTQNRWSLAFKKVSVFWRRIKHQRASSKMKNKAQLELSSGIRSAFLVYNWLSRYFLWTYWVEFDKLMWPELYSSIFFVASSSNLINLGLVWALSLSTLLMTKALDEQTTGAVLKNLEHWCSDWCCKWMFSANLTIMQYYNKEKEKSSNQVHWVYEKRHENGKDVLFSPSWVQPKWVFYNKLDGRLGKDEFRLCLSYH